MSTLCTLRMWPSRWLAFASPQATGVALGVLAAVIWGSYFALARAGVSVGLYATDIAAIRYGVAGLIMLPWLLRSGAMGMAGIGLMRACALALLVGPLFIIIGVSGYNFAPFAHGAVVQPAALTLGSIGLASLVLRDRPTVARIIGVTIMLAGLAIIAGPGLLKERRSHTNRRCNVCRRRPDVGSVYDPFASLGHLTNRGYGRCFSSFRRCVSTNLRRRGRIRPYNRASDANADRTGARARSAVWRSCGDCVFEGCRSARSWQGGCISCSHPRCSYRARRSADRRGSNDVAVMRSRVRQPRTSVQCRCAPHPLASRPVSCGTSILR